MVYNKIWTDRKIIIKTEIHAYFKKITLFKGIIIVMPKLCTCMHVILTLGLSQINVKFRNTILVFIKLILHRKTLSLNVH